MRPIKRCKVEGCNSKPCAKGYCKFHWQRKVNNIPLNVPKNWGKREEQHHDWKGGYSRLSGHPLSYNKFGRRIWRHKKGISKKYICKYGGKAIPTKFFSQQYKALKRAAGPLTVQTIQQTYEDNIKEFGTLTCYLCLRPIEFGQDCLEHKISLSRGGTNIKGNLAIAHRSCNNKKGNKTEEEYRREILAKWKS